MTSRNARQAAIGANPARISPASMAVARAVAKESAPPPPAAARSQAAARPARGARRPPGTKPPRSDPMRLAELKVKLSDEDYMSGAILRIATVLSARLTLR
jgi:hypothetical protein